VKRPILFGVCSLILVLPFCGCTSLSDYIHNGFKVGPQYGRPPAPVAKDWIDGNDLPRRKDTGELSKWWTVFHDPALDRLICLAYQQNLTLRAAGMRVLQARAQLGIARGEIFPQSQFASGGYTWDGTSAESAATSTRNVLNRFFGQYTYGFSLAWELDFWGKFRRAIESASDSLDVSVDGYDDVLVTLLGDVASNYVTMRTTQLRIAYAYENVGIQSQTLNIAIAKAKAGDVKELDVDQAKTLLDQTASGIPELEITLRQTTNQLCILLGIPPEDLRARLQDPPPPSLPPAVDALFSDKLLAEIGVRRDGLPAKFPITRLPKAPPPEEVAVGIPADLLRRRPDVREAERQAAAQCALIGVAEADFYPHLSLVGTFGYSAQFFKNLWNPQAFQGNFGPSFQWDILNYGRILNNVRLQDAKFQELVADYQEAVLNAQQDVENGLVSFLKARNRFKLLERSVLHAERAVKAVMAQYQGGITNLTAVTQLQQILLQEQDTEAQAEGEVLLGLIQVYRALGGGWELRLTGCDPNGPPPPPDQPGAPREVLPPPRSMPSQLPPPAPAPSAQQIRAAQFGTPVPN
jgi:outer membrane protein TolC